MWDLHVSSFFPTHLTSLLDATQYLHIEHGRAAQFVSACRKNHASFAHLELWVVDTLRVHCPLHRRMQFLHLSCTPKKLGRSVRNLGRPVSYVQHLLDSSAFRPFRQRDDRRVPIHILVLPRLVLVKNQSCSYFFPPSSFEESLSRISWLGEPLPLPSLVPSVLSNNFPELLLPFLFQYTIRLTRDVALEPPPPAPDLDATWKLFADQRSEALSKFSCLVADSSTLFNRSPPAEFQTGDIINGIITCSTTSLRAAL